MMLSIARIAVFSGAAIVAMGCASRTAQSVRITSAELSTEYGEEATESAIRGNYARALVLADRAVALSPGNAWPHYDRAVALHHLRRTEDAVAAYRDAARKFGDGAVWAKSIAIYGSARALDDAGRCVEAKAAYAEFAAFVQGSDPRGAEMARTYAAACQPARSVDVDPVSSSVGEAVVARDYARALSLAETAPASQEPRPWLEYNRAVAFAELGKTDDAVQAFNAAERQFKASEPQAPASARGRVVAIYGRARALDTAGRCAEAKRAYAEYAALVHDREDAAAASRIAGQCGGTP